MLYFLIFIIVFTISVSFFGLAFWGVGSLIVFAFGINFTFTYLQGFGISLAFHILWGIFKN